MKILMLFPWALDRLGGAEVAAGGLAQELARRGHSCHLVQMVSGSEGVSATQAEKSVVLHSIPELVYQGRWSPRSWCSLLFTVGRLTRLIWRSRAEVVHVHFPVWQSLAAFCAVRLTGKPLVVTVQGDDVLVWPDLRPGLRRWQRWLLERARVVVATSKELAARCGGLCASEVRVIGNPAPCEWLRFEAERPPGPYLFFCGRLEPQKGVDLLLRAWERLQERLPECELWLAGEGAQRRELENTVARMKLSRVRFLGRVERCRLPQLYQGAELFVLPSRYEGAPLALLEACACGALVLATRVGGNAEIVEDKVSGVLIAPDSEQALVEGVLKTLTLPSEQRAQMRQVARSRIATQFTQESVGDRYEQLFAELLYQA